MKYKKIKNTGVLYVLRTIMFTLYLQLSQHNKELANLLKPCGDLYGDTALEFYARHTAQIEVSDKDWFSRGSSDLINDSWMKFGSSKPREL